MSASDLSAFPKRTAGTSERERARILHQHDLPALPEEAFDRLTELATQVFEVQTAFVAFVIEKHQWLESAAGLPDEEASLAASLGRGTVQHAAPMTVEDAAEDAHFAGDSMVAEEKARFYAGAPFAVEDGCLVGAFGIMEPEPRELSDAEIQQLTTFAETVANQLEQWRGRPAQEEHAQEEQVQELEQQKAALQALIEHLPAGVLVEDDDRTIQMANATFCELFGRDATPDALVGQDAAAHAEAAKDLLAAPDRFIGSAERALDAGEPHRDEFETTDGRTLTRDYVPFDHACDTAHLWVYRDVTSERERERMLSGLFDDALYGIGVKDIVTNDEGQPVDYIYREVNETFEAMTGLAAEEVLGKRATEAIDGIEETPFIEMFGEVGLGGTPIRFEQYSEPLDRYYEISAFSPRPGQCVTLFSDITERKEREHELAAARERVKLALEATDSLIFEVNVTSETVQRYGPTRRVIGTDLDQPLSFGTYAETVVHPDDREIHRQFYQALKSGERDAGELTYRSVAGETVCWIRDRAHAYRYDGERHVVGIAQDVTERKEAERELEERERFLRSVTEGVTDGIFQSTLDGTIRYANQALANIFGYESSEELKDTNPETLYASQETRDRLVEKLRASGALANEEVRFRCKDGSVFTGRMSATPVYDDQGNIVHYNGVIVDITDQKEREQALRESKEEAEAAARLKEAILSNLSHEVRTPLSGIIGYAEILQDTLEDQPESREFADHIRDASEQLRHTLETMLNLSKLEGGAYELRPRRVDLVEVVEEVVGELAPEAHDQKVEVTTQTPELLEGYWDRDALRRILRNLLDNAIKFTPEDGRVWVRARHKDDTAVLEVEDTGIGISEETRDAIFEPFKQESAGLNREYGGTGFGLAVVREFVGLMDGQLDLDSEKGEGTCFTTRLPRHAAAEKIE